MKYRILMYIRISRLCMESVPDSHIDPTTDDDGEALDPRIQVRFPRL